jgi:hypothetical protein
MVKVSRTEKFLVLTCSVLLILLVFVTLNTGGNIGLVTGRYAGTEAKEKVSVDFFAMSMCSHCSEFEPVVRDILGLLDNNIRFRMFYVARQNNGDFQSMHGVEEIEEDIRQLCVNEYYPDKFWNYVLCIGENYRNPGSFWESCSEKNGIDIEKVRGCWQGEEGNLLLVENIKKADYLKITKSPVLMINKRIYTGKRTANALKDWICDEFGNPPEECNVDMEGLPITGAIVGTPSTEFCELR